MQTCIKNNKKMEKEKYYTPNEDEFSSGFEYERYESSWIYDIKQIKNNLDGSIEAKVLSEPKQVADWRKRVYKLDDFCYIKDGELECWYNPEVLRVKYLDREDIESFGFKKRLKDEWIGWKDYALDTISGEIHYFLSATIHIPRMDDCYKIYLHRYLDDDTKLETGINEGESELVYKGKIKNRSELFRLLKQLSII